MGIFKRVKSLVRNIDMYGYPVGLRYNSGNSYQTFIGGFFTIISKIAIFSFIVYGLIDVYKKKNQIVKKTLFKDKFIDKSRIHLTPDNFDVGIAFTTAGETYEAQDSIFRYFKVHWSNFGVSYIDGQFVATNTEIEVAKCTGDRFDGNSDVINAMGLLSFYCPKDLDTEVFGSQTGESNQFTLFISPCNNDTLLESGANYTCAPNEAIESVFDTSLVTLVVMSSYFDMFEFDQSPIKKQFKTFVYFLKYDTGYGQDIYVQENEVITQDSWFGTFFGKSTYSYFDTVNGNQYHGATQPNLLEQLSIYFMISPYQDTVTRQVQSLVDVLTQAGGFSSVIAIVANFSIIKLQQQLFYQSIIKKIFKIQKNSQHHDDEDDDKDQKGSKKNKPKVRQSQSATYNEEEGKKLALVDYYKASISQRIRPKISILKQRLYNYMCCFKRKSSYILQQKQLFANAMEMLDEQFDIIQIMQSVRASNLVRKLILSKGQSKLLPYFKDNIISSVKQHDSHLKNKKYAHATLDQDVLTNTIQKLLDQQVTSHVSKKLLKNLINTDDKHYDPNIFTKSIQDDSNVNFRKTMTQIQYNNMSTVKESPISRQQKNSINQAEEEVPYRVQFSKFKISTPTNKPKVKKRDKLDDFSEVEEQQTMTRIFQKKDTYKKRKERPQLKIKTKTFIMSENPTN